MNNAAFTTFIDEKYIPLAPKIKLAITLGIIVLPLVIFYFTYFHQKAEKIQNLNKQKATLAQQIKEVKIKTANLAKFEKEMAEAENLFLEASALLPREKEIPKRLE